MAYPQTYNRAYDFASYQNANPTRPLPGARINLELNDIQRAVGEIITTLRGVTRSDGALANGSVGLDQLSPEAIIGLEAPTVWAAGVNYTTGNTVFNGAILYRANVDHTSAEPFDATKWDELADLTSVFNSLSEDVDEAVDTAEAAAAAAAASADAAAAFAGATATFFATNTSAAAAAIPAGVVPLLRTGGSATPNDNGGGFFLEVDAMPAYEPRFQHPGNTKWRKLVGFARPGVVVITPEMYGSDGTTAADWAAYAKMQIATLALRDEGVHGVEWHFKPGKVYRAFDTATVTPGGPNGLWSMSGLKGFKIRAHEARFASNFNFPAAVPGSGHPNIGTGCFFLNLVGCLDTDIDLLDFAAEAVYTTTNLEAGAWLLMLGDACKNTHVGRLKMKGGTECVAINKSGAFNEGDRGRFYQFDSIEAEDVYYVLNPQFKGDFITANINARNCGRSYMPISASNHRIRLRLDEDRAGIAQSCHLAVGCYPGGWNKLSEIDLEVRGTVLGSIVNLQFGQDSAVSTPGKMTNIKVRVDLENGPGSAGNLLGITKTLWAGAGGGPDNVARGHSMDNICISGVLRNVGAGTAPAALFTTANFTGENLENVRLEDLYISGAGAVAVDGRGFTKPNSFKLKNIEAEFNNATLANFADGVLDASHNVNFMNLKSVGVSGGTRYERLQGGRVRMSKKNTCANGVTNTDFVFPLTLRGTADAVVEGVAPNAAAPGAVEDISVTVPTTGKATITRAPNAGARDVFVTVNAAVAADGSPI